MFFIYKKFPIWIKRVLKGIEISAYLTEIYIRDFDEYIKFMDDIIFYPRYVWRYNNCLCTKTNHRRYI
jgi:hypothetical protein